jgi:lysophospholipase
MTSLRNAPERRDLVDVIKEACEAGVVIVTISQCAKGSVSAHYAAGRSLTDAGVVAGVDMTLEVHLHAIHYEASLEPLN